MHQKQPPAKVAKAVAAEIVWVPDVKANSIMNTAERLRYIVISLCSELLRYDQS